MQGLLTAIESLRARKATGKPEPEHKPTHLPLVSIDTCEDVFQHRSGNLAASNAHLETLKKALQAGTCKFFEPITVYWIDGSWCCIDGHHRLQAYRDQKVDVPIPVNVYSGTLDKAIGKALLSNSRDKLAMSQAEKSNAAWRLVIGTGLSKSSISKAASVSERTVARMRCIKMDIVKNHPEKPLDDLDWKHAQALAQGRNLSDLSDLDSWKEKAAQKLANTLSRHCGKELSKSPEITARALEIYDQRLLSEMIEWVSPAPDDFEADHPEWVIDGSEEPDF